MEINTKFKALYFGDWNLDVDQHIKEFMNNRFSDNAPGRNEYPTRMQICGCLLVVVYYGFSGTYMYFIDGETNHKRYQPGKYMVKKVTKELKKAAGANNDQR